MAGWDKCRGHSPDERGFGRMGIVLAWDALSGRWYASGATTDTSWEDWYRGEYKGWDLSGLWGRLGRCRNSEKHKNIKGGARSSIADAHRDLTTPQPSPTGIPYRYKAAVRLPSMSGISDAILGRTPWISASVLRELLVLFWDVEELERLIEEARDRVVREVRAVWREMQEMERLVFKGNSWNAFMIRNRQIYVRERMDHDKEPGEIYGANLIPTFSNTSSRRRPVRRTWILIGGLVSIMKMLITYKTRIEQRFDKWRKAYPVSLLQYTIFVLGLIRCRIWTRFPMRTLSGITVEADLVSGRNGVLEVQATNVASLGVWHLIYIPWELGEN